MLIINIFRFLTEKMKLSTSAVFYLLGMAELALADSKFGTYHPPPRHMQIDSESLTHEVCSRSVDRLIKQNVDFNEVLAANTGDWIDESFNFPDVFSWSDMRVGSDSDQSGLVKQT